MMMTMECYSLRGLSATAEHASDRRGGLVRYLEAGKALHPGSRAHSFPAYLPTVIVCGGFDPSSVVVIRSRSSSSVGLPYLRVDAWRIFP